MVDTFVLVMMHGLLAFAAWRLLLRNDLDADPQGDPPPIEQPQAEPDA